MKKRAFFILIGFLLILTADSCNVFTNSFKPYEEHNNPDAFRSIAMVEHDNMNRLSFGTSSGNSSQNKVTVNEDGSIDMYASNATWSAGKIAGSEDGISFYFKEVNANKNFKLTADAAVKFFGSLDVRTDLNGQEGFGLMARDYVPQYAGKTMADLKNIGPTGNYYAGSTGGTGNMILVGGVKRGVRVYWRTGVIDPTTPGATDWSPAGEGDCIYTNTVIANADKAVFQFIPKELPDYSIYPTMQDRPDYAPPGSKYTLYLEKNNSGFRCIITPPPGRGGDLNYQMNPYDPASDNPKVVGLGQKLEYFIPEPDLLTSINKNHYYVGFFAARDAEVTISNIHYEEADADDCAPKIEQLPDVYTPSVSVYSPGTTSTADYTLYARANVEGNIAVSLNGAKLPDELGKGVWTVENSNAVAKPFANFAVPVTNLKDGDNVFQLAFYPDPKQSNSQFLLSSTNAVTMTFIVNRKTYGDTDGHIYVSPDGRRTNKGTSASPLDLETAIDYVQPGQVITMKDGIYSPLAVLIPRYNSGKPNKDPGASTSPMPSNPDYKADPYYKYYKVLEAEHRDRAVIDFLGHPQNQAFVLRGDYWVISGIHVRGSSPAKQKGFTIMGNYNRLEWVKVYRSGDTGMQISGDSGEPKSCWPSYNTVAYCESFYNKDEAQTDADGFSAKLTVGDGNHFEWCVSHNNVDDGWDLFTKKETGPTGIVTIDHCISYGNGVFLSNYPAGWDLAYSHAGNGFKMGGEGISVFHQVSNCLSFGNGGDGFTSNSNPAIQIANCTAVDNQGRGFVEYGSGTSDPTGLDARLSLGLSMYSGGSILPYGAGSHSNDSVWWDVTDTNVGYIWRSSSCRNRSDAVLTMGSNIVSTELPWVDNLADPTFDTSVSGPIGGKFIPRNADGSFKLNDFMKPQGVFGSQPGASGLY